jgi:hypothetical protein
MCFNLATEPSPSPPYAGRYTIASRFWCRSCECGLHCPRAPNGSLPPRSNLVGYVRWDGRSDRFLLSDNQFQRLYRSQPLDLVQPIRMAERSGPAAERHGSEQHLWRNEPLPKINEYRADYCYVQTVPNTITAFPITKEPNAPKKPVVHLLCF